MAPVFALHLITTAFMCGVCWFVQIVHYPLLCEIPEERFSNYVLKNFRTAWVVGPAMLLELGSGLWLAYEFFGFIFLMNIVWLGIIWLSTAVIQMPLHRKLSIEYSLRQKRLLIRSNWIRTIFWSLRCLILAYYMTAGSIFAWTG